jgi:hypothetical protein
MNEGSAAKERTIVGRPPRAVPAWRWPLWPITAAIILFDFACVPLLMNELIPPIQIPAVIGSFAWLGIASLIYPRLPGHRRADH